MRCVTSPVRDRRSRRQFFALPATIYRGDPAWTPTPPSALARDLDGRSNPYFRSARVDLHLCRRDGRPAARAVSVVYAGTGGPLARGEASFGLFESVDDAEVARSLFDAVAEAARSGGASALVGPMSPHRHGELGLLVAPSSYAPALFQPHNPPYYAALLEGAGFRVAHRMTTARNDDAAAYVRARYGPGEPPARSGDFVARPIRLDDFDAEVERIREVTNDAFADAYEFAPLSREEYAWSAASLRRVARPDLVTIVERGGEPVAVLILVEDVAPALRALRGRRDPWHVLRYVRARRQARDLVVYAVAVKKAHRNGRAFLLLLAALRRAALRCRSISTTWMSEGNRAIHDVLDRAGLVPDREYAVYRKPLVVDAAAAEPSETTRAA